MPSKLIPRVTQLLAHSLAVVFALGTFIPLGQLLYKYDYRCVLNSHLAVKVVVNGTSSPSVFIDGESSEWGDRSLCLFTIFVAVFVAIHAFVWTWFYVHLIRTLRETGREMTLFIPVFVCHALLFVCAFVSSAFLSSCSGKLCPAVKILSKQKFSCSELSDMTWHSDLSPTLNSLPPFSRITVAQVSSWVMTVMVAIPCVVAIYHLFVSVPVVYEVDPEGKDGPLTEHEDLPIEDLPSNGFHDRSSFDRSSNVSFGKSFTKSSDSNRLV